MKEAQPKSDSKSRVASPIALATSLAIGAFGGSCGSQDYASLPGPQPKVTVSKPEPLLGADGALTVNKAGTIINNYSKLAADAKTGDATISVASATALNLKAGDLIMVVQMQGATIDTTDAVANGVGYGNVKMLNNAGQYEIASVKSVDTTGNTVTLDYCGGLKNNYTAAGHAQVVRVPQYTTVTVQAGGSITAMPWDGDKGGVVAAYVQGKTTLVGNIDASATGFRGGAMTNGSDDPAMNIVTYRSTTMTDGGEHGEGIAGFEVEYDALNGRYGRGAPANGGGGGNSHNGGGGGGANNTNGNKWSGAGVMTVPLGNLTFGPAWKLDPDYIANGNQLTNSSGGGRGGYTYAAKMQDPTQKAPGDASWAGNLREEVGGLGGQPLINSPKNTLFLGGGGGAGNGNNNSAGAGGIGGGMVFLVTAGVEGTGAILANGGAGGNTINGGGVQGNDAAGGGGAGGTVVVLSGLNIGATLKLGADGGVGGNQNISATLDPESEGPGGGGGGGYVGTFSAQPTLAARSAVGANSGTTNSTGVATFNVNGATNGAAGNSADTLTYQDGPKLPVCVPSDLSTTVALTKGSINPGSIAQLTVTVSNSGPETAQTALITDQIQNGITLTWTCAGNGGANCPPLGTGVGSITGITDVPAQGSLVYTVNATIPPGFVGPFTYTAGAVVPPGFNDLNLMNNQGTTSLPIGSVPNADLGIAMTASPNPGQAGSPISYDVKVTNNGPGTATGASFTYTIPPGGTVQNITAPAGWNCPQPAQGATTLTCTYTPSVLTQGVPPGALPDVTISVLPQQGACDALAVATVSVQGATDPTPGNNTAFSDTPIGAGCPPADFSVAVNSTPNPAPQGSPITYDIRVNNGGPNTATGASIIFDLPQGSTLQNFDNSASGWNCTQAGSAVACTYSQSVPQGTLPDVMISVLPDPNATSAVVTAQAAGQGVSDPNLANNMVTETTVIGNAPQADLVLTVTTSPNPPQPNMPITYNFDIANKGPGTATGAVLTYTIPTNGTVQSITAPQGWNCSQVTSQNQVSCWYSGDIDPNSSAPDVQVVVVPNPGATELDSTTTVTPNGATDPNPSDDTVTTMTQLLTYRLQGGGFSCNAAPISGQPGALGGVLATLLGLLGLRRRRRS